MKNVFLFSGQGSQFYPMGLELYQNRTTFQTQLNPLYRDLSRFSVIDTIYDPSKHPSAILNPSVFVSE